MIEEGVQRRSARRQRRRSEAGGASATVVSVPDDRIDDLQAGSDVRHRRPALGACRGQFGALGVVLGEDDSVEFRGDPRNGTETVVIHNVPMKCLQWAASLLIQGKYIVISDDYRRCEGGIIIPWSVVQIRPPLPSFQAVGIGTPDSAGGVSAPCQHAARNRRTAGTSAWPRAVRLASGCTESRARQLLARAAQRRTGRRRDAIRPVGGHPRRFPPENFAHFPVAPTCHNSRSTRRDRTNSLLISFHFRPRAPGGSAVSERDTLSVAPASLVARP